MMDPREIARRNIERDKAKRKSGNKQTPEEIQAGAQALWVKLWEYISEHYKGVTLAYSAKGHSNKEVDQVIDWLKDHGWQGARKPGQEPDGSWTTILSVRANKQ